MRKLFVALFMMGLVSTAFVSCRETAGDKMEDAADDAGDAVEDAVD